ncbi:MAG: MMPL family transporter [Pseudomonadales bacterium]|nr:MMPL family transporter [Pseudomonadales bacterium]
MNRVSDFSGFLIKQRIALALFSALLISVAAIGLNRITIDNHFRNFLSEDDTYLEVYDKINDTFVEADSILFLLGPGVLDPEALGPTTGTIFTKEFIAIVDELSQSGWQVPFSIHVDSLTSYLHTSVEGDLVTTDYLIGDIESLDSPRLEQIKNIALNDKVLLNHLISEAGDVTVINVTLAMPEDDPAANAQVAQHVLNVQNKLREKYPSLVIYAIGSAVANQVFETVNQKEMMMLIPTVILVCFVVVGLCLRSVFSVFGTLLIIITSVVLTMGTVGWYGTSLDGNSGAAASFIILLALADSVHLLTSFCQKFNQGMASLKAMQLSIELNFKPVLLTSLTTAIGFLALNFGGNPSLALFGNIIALGVLFAFILTFTLLPAFVLVFSLKSKMRPVRVNSLMEWISKFVVDHDKKLLFSLLSVTLLLCLLAPMNEIDEDNRKNFDKKLEFRTALDLLGSKMKNGGQLLFSLDSNESGGVNHPEFLRKVNHFSEWLRTQQEVSNVRSYVDILKDQNRKMHGDDPAWESVPDSKSLASQYMLLYEFSLPAGHDLSRDINHDRSALKLTVTVNELTSKQLIVLENRINKWMNENMPEFNQKMTGLRLIFAHAGLNTTYDLLVGAGVTLLVITLLLVVGLSSLRYGLLSIIPNLFPAAVVFGFWYLLVGRIDGNVAILLSISIGLVVDDTVHLLSKYIEARSRGESPNQAIQYAFTTAGVAIFVTTFAIGLGVLVLLNSSWVPMQYVAKMLSSIVFVALILDLFLLPSILFAMERFWQSSRFSFNRLN